MLLRTLASLVATLILMANAAPAFAEPNAAVRPLADLARSCHDLMTAAQLPETTVRSATWKTASHGVEYCEIAVVISPAAGSHIGAVYRLPARWNGRLLGLGGGGMAGDVTLEPTLIPLAMGFGTAQTDAGHESASVWDTRWALLPDGKQNWPGMEDFAYRAIHAMTETGKAVMTRFYGAAPSRSYFQGCSTGGRQALMEAQRFPSDYDGIVAGAPVYDERVASSMVNSGRIFDAPAAELDAMAIQRVNDAILRACDARDGVADGIVTVPAQCRWDPGLLSCAGAKTSACLSEAQVAALRSAYRDVRSPDGRIAAFGLPKGAELTALPIFMTWGAQVPEQVGLDKWREAQFENADFDYRNWDIGRDFFRLRTTPFAFMYDATNPDLSDFVVRGGKLILWHGLYDQLPRERSTEEYFRQARAATQAMLDAKSETGRATDDLRYFELPGVAHCRSGPGADSFDGLQAIVDWVEHGSAPDHLTAFKQNREAPVPQSAHVPDAAIVLSRPLCSYPSLPSYKGQGDPAKASSFSCRVRRDRQ